MKSVESNSERSTMYVEEGEQYETVSSDESGMCVRRHVANEREESVCVCVRVLFSICSIVSFPFSLRDILSPQRDDAQHQTDESTNN